MMRYKLSNIKSVRKEFYNGIACGYTVEMCGRHYAETHSFSTIVKENKPIKEYPFNRLPRAVQQFIAAGSASGYDADAKYCKFYTITYTMEDDAQ